MSGPEPTWSSGWPRLKLTRSEIGELPENLRLTGGQYSVIGVARYTRTLTLWSQTLRHTCQRRRLGSAQTLTRNKCHVSSRLYRAGLLPVQSIPAEHRGGCVCSPSGTTGTSNCPGGETRRTTNICTGR